MNFLFIHLHLVWQLCWWFRQLGPWGFIQCSGQSLREYSKSIWTSIWIWWSSSWRSPSYRNYRWAYTDLLKSIVPGMKLLFFFRLSMYSVSLSIALSTWNVSHLIKNHSISAFVFTKMTTNRNTAIQLVGTVCYSIGT